eukprot:m.315914 g.315914  ORF g.315914 m.315914 type:complete len:211 (-) comp16417_c0_seq7:2169-2801(-)
MASSTSPGGRKATPRETANPFENTSLQDRPTWWLAIEVLTGLTLAPIRVVVFLLALLIALLFSVIPLWLFSCCRDPSQPRHLGQTIALFPLVVYELIPPPPFPQIVVLSRGHPSWYSSKSTRTTTLMRLERQGVPDAAVVFWNLVDLCSSNERVCSKLGRNTGDCTESYLATRPRVDQLSVLLPVDGGEVCSGRNPRNWNNHQSYPDNIC